MALTPEELTFLKSKSIPLGQVFDATGLSRSAYRARMKVTGQHFAAGTTPCARSGHTLRTRAGHCIQCNPENIAYQVRHLKESYIYLAASLAKKLIKVGSSSDIADRHKTLNYYGYAGAVDWSILLKAYTEEAGRYESDTHRRLRRYQVAVPYSRADTAREAFSCTYKQAKAALLASLPPHVKVHMVNARTIALLERT